MFTTRPELTGTFGMVASTHWLATAVGMATLEKGGNAFDAAVAAGFVLQVVEPHLNGPGGDLPIIAHRAVSGETDVICGQGVTPAGATLEHYRAQGIGIIPGDGLLAACVPGAFDAWMTMLAEYGTMTPREVMAPAIGYAADGYPLVPGILGAIASVADLFRDEWPGSAELYLPGGNPPSLVRLFRNPQLAATYTRIVETAEAAGGDRHAHISAARDAFYRGFVADAIDRFCRDAYMDGSGQRNAGVLTGDDMAKWSAPVEAPLTYDYGGLTICKPGPWSQGPVFLQQLALLKEYDLAAMDPVGADFVHTVAECAKLAFADRDAWYADPDFADVPMDDLLSDSYAAARRADVAVDSASEAYRPGAPGGRTPYLPMLDPAALTGDMMAAANEPTRAFANVANNDAARDAVRDRAMGDTCHLDVVDRDGNMVSATPSGGWLQSSPTIPELGFCLGTRAQMFWLDERATTVLAPGRRPRTTLTPSMALRDGKGHLAFGTPGGDQQDQWSLTFFLRWLHHGMGIQASIDTPMFDVKHFSSSFYPRQPMVNQLSVEGRFDAATVADLRRRGHGVTVEEDWSLGRISAVACDDGVLRAGANPRFSQGYAAGR